MEVTHLEHDNKHVPNNLESKPHISQDSLTTTAKYKVSHSFSFKYCSSNPPLKLLKISILSPFINNLWNHFYSQSGLRSPFHFFPFRLLPSISIALTKLFYKLKSDLNFLFLCLSTCESLKIFPVSSDKTMAILKYTLNRHLKSLPIYPWQDVSSLNCNTS